MTNIRRILLSMLVGLVLSLFAVSISTACSTPTLLGGASWAPNAIVGVATTGVPSAVTIAIANWNASFTVFGICDAPTLIASSSTGAPKITMSYVFIPNHPCPNDPTKTCADRGITQFGSATYSGGYLSTVPIQLNTQLTVAAAITEVAAHEIGHTFGLFDCNGCALNSSVMESNPPASGGPYTVNSLVGTPGPTGCDLIEVAFVKSPGYLCPPQSTCANPQGQPPAGCSNAQWDTVSCTWTCSGSPIIIDISGQGFSLTDATDGVWFDISGTGHPIQMGWSAGANNAFLALPGADGLVHNGKQLFGNFTPQPQSSTPNGFAALAIYDDPRNGGNGDGVIDSKDAIFSSLRLWIDANHDGISQPEEIHTLPELGVTSISLDYYEDRRRDEYGNVFRYRARINPDDTDLSHVGRIAYDVFFVVQGNSSTAKRKLPADKCPVPSKKVGMLAPVSSSLR